MHQLVQLEEWREQFEAAGVKVAAMTYDSVEILAGFHAKRNLGYPLLHDEEARHVVGFKVLNEAYSPGDMAYGIPHPGIFYLSPEGEVVAKYAVPGYRQRPPMQEVLDGVRTAAAPAQPAQAETEAEG